eukprot:TRINITY_DN909_c0_g1_i2.p1 TRINITY_DN909_c0_g1~~TRINITY_DN909_c0_g1_i2.p1  ORF type:complete len:404 (+),score=138.61 TRINITY_DN909_c0_g1_i2:41-1252(+)
MPLEATVICLDNSEWMRNGDYTPTRMEAQHDAANLICGAKTQQNPESTVACMSGAGKSPEVLVTLTSDLGKMLSALHNIKLQPELNFSAAIQVANLVLKHRQNKNQQQRIIFFVGSPVKEDTNELVRLAKRLKKNNIAVDVVNFGEQEENTQKLEAFIQNVNNNDNSHLVTIPPGPHILSDIIITSPIITGGEDGGGGASGPSTSSAQDFSAYGGVDPNLDPELALALKVSLEEARAQQEAESKKQQDTQPAPSATNTTNTTSSTSADTMDVDDDAELAKALALSMQQSQSAPTSEAPKPSTTNTTTTTSNTSTSTTTNQDTVMNDVDDDEEMKLALQMSMQASTNTSTNNDVDLSKIMEDPNFVNSVLSTLPGVDPNDETIKNVLASISKPDDKSQDKDKKQ